MGTLRREDWSRYDHESGWALINRIETWCSRWWAEALAEKRIADAHEWMGALFILKGIRRQWGFPLRRRRVSTTQIFPGMEKAVASDEKVASD